MCLLDTLCIYFGEMSAQRSVHFSNWVFLLNFKILFYFIVTSPFLDMCITDPFPQHVDCLFIILMGASENSGFLILVNSSLSFFFHFIVHTFYVLLENICLFQSCRSFLN